MALTGKRRFFADAVLAGSSHREAAIAAGYSAKTASQAGSRMAKYPDVIAYLAEQRQAVAATPKSAPAAPPAGASPFDVGSAILHTDPQAFLLAAMNDGRLDPRQRIIAARSLMPFVHAKVGEGGKKEQKAEAAKQAGSRFAPAAPPKLVAAGGKKV